MILSSPTRQGPLWQFPPWEALGVDLAEHINIWITPTPSGALYPFIPLSFGKSFHCGGPHTQAQTHIRGVDGHAPAVKRNWTDLLPSKECVYMCGIDVSSLFHLLQTAPYMITLKLSERERQRKVEKMHLREYHLMSYLMRAVHQTTAQTQNGVLKGLAVL